MSEYICANHKLIMSYILGWLSHPTSDLYWAVSLAVEFVSVNALCLLIGLHRRRLVEVLLLISIESFPEYALNILPSRVGDSPSRGRGKNLYRYSWYWRYLGELLGTFGSHGERLCGPKVIF